MKILGVLTVSSDGKFLVTQEKGWLRVWNITRGVPVSKVPLYDEGNVLAAFSPNGRLLATYSGRALEGESSLWDVRTRRMIHLLSRQWGAHAFAFSPNGRLLAMVGRRFTASSDEKKRVLMWDVSSGDVSASLEVTLSGSRLVFSPVAESWQFQLLRRSSFGR